MWDRVRSTAIRLWKDEQGASLLEYSLLVGIILAVTVAIVGAVGTWVTGRWTGLCTALNITCPGTTP